MALPGEKVELPISRIERNEAWLLNGEEEVFITLADIPAKCKIGDQLKVVLFFNESNELEATTELPEIELNQAGTFRVLNTSKNGAFVDMGLKRDVIIPENEIQEPLKEGQKCIVVLKYNKQDNNLYGSTRLSKHFPNYKIELKRGDKVDILISQKLELGRKVVINNKHTGILFKQEIHQSLRIGDKLKAYVRKIEDNEITVSLQQEGKAEVETAAKRVLQMLESTGGYARLTDDTDPEEIKARLKMSKNTYKKAATYLSNEGKVKLTKRGIKLVKK